MLAKGFSKPTDRVERLRSMIVDAVPCIEAERAVLITESYQATEGLPSKPEWLTHLRFLKKIRLL